MAEDTTGSDVAVRRELAYLLRCLLQEAMTPDDVIRQINALPRPTETENDLVTVLHALYHYRDDTDIRRRDSEYAKRQIRGLSLMIERLDAGLSLSQDQDYYWPS